MLTYTYCVVTLSRRVLPLFVNDNGVITLSDFASEALKSIRTRTRAESPEWAKRLSTFMTQVMDGTALSENRQPSRRPCMTEMQFTQDGVLNSTYEPSSIALVYQDGEWLFGGEAEDFMGAVWTAADRGWGSFGLTVEKDVKFSIYKPRNNSDRMWCFDIAGAITTNHISVLSMALYHVGEDADGIAMKESERMIVGTPSDLASTLRSSGHKPLPRGFISDSMQIAHDEFSRIIGQNTQAIQYIATHKNKLWSVQVVHGLADILGINRNAFSTDRVDDEVNTCKTGGLHCFPLTIQGRFNCNVYSKVLRQHIIK